MAHISASFRSKALNMPVEAEIIVPQMKNVKYKVLILLHTGNNDRMEWLLKSPVYDIVKAKPVLVFMPSGKNSGFVNTLNGYRYMDYISKEIPEFIIKHFDVSTDKEDWLIAGASMGGYGAFVNALHETKRFGNIASFSGSVDIYDKASTLPTIRKELLFDSDKDKNEALGYELFSFSHTIKKEQRPRVFMCCGMEDPFFEMNERFYDEIKNEYQVTYLKGEGKHNYTYWNSVLPKMFSWFFDKEAVL